MLLGEIHTWKRMVKQITHCMVGIPYLSSCRLHLLLISFHLLLYGITSHSMPRHTVLPKVRTEELGDLTIYAASIQ
jgi:hypothetical protein